MTKISAQTLVALANEKGIIETLYDIFGKTFSLVLSVNQQTGKISIEDMDLSVRSYNALKRSGISTVNDLMDCISSGELSRIRNLGKKSINEIKTKLLKLAYENSNEKEKLRFCQSIIDKNILKQAISF